MSRLFRTQFTLMAVSRRSRGWQGTDGSDTALMVYSSGKVVLWTNLGEWLELSTDVDPWAEAENLADAMGLVPMHPDRLRYLLGEPMSRDEEAGWADSQVKP